MKRILLFFIATNSLLISCDIRKSEKQETANSDNQKKKLTDTTTVQIIDTTYNFNKVKEGDVVEFSYRFKNIGSKPLVIEQASASCGCTVPEKPEHAIAPGEMGFIKVKFNSANRPGQAEKTITVVSNALPEFPQLFLKGTVIGKTEEK